MSKLIPRIPFAELPEDLAELLRPRVDRLGYLGEFYQCTAHQPRALMRFYNFTDELKKALPDRLTETVALTVAAATGNDYERAQHERLSLKLGFGERWVRDVLTMNPDEAETLDEDELAVQRFAIAAVANYGRGAQSHLDAMTEKIGYEHAVAVVLLVGRYAAHSLMVNSLDLAPPVTSPLR